MLNEHVKIKIMLYYGTTRINGHEGSDSGICHCIAVDKAQPRYPTQYGMHATNEMNNALWLA